MEHKNPEHTAINTNATNIKKKHRDKQLFDKLTKPAWQTHFCWWSVKCLAFPSTAAKILRVLNFTIGLNLKNENTNTYMYFDVEMFFLRLTVKLVSIKLKLVNLNWNKVLVSNVVHSYVHGKNKIRNTN